MQVRHSTPTLRHHHVFPSCWPMKPWGNSVVTPGVTVPSEAARRELYWADLASRIHSRRGGARHYCVCYPIACLFFHGPSAYKDLFKILGGTDFSPKWIIFSPKACVVCEGPYFQVFKIKVCSLESFIFPWFCPWCCRVDILRVVSVLFTPMYQVKCKGCMWCLHLFFFPQ